MRVTSQFTLMLISSLIFLSISFFFLVILHHLSQRAKKRRLVEKIQQGDGMAEALDSIDSPPRARGGVQQRIFAFLSSLGKRVGPDKSEDYSRARAKFLKAGFRRENAVTVFWGIKCFFAICFPVTFFLVRIMVFKLVSPSATMAICTFLAFSGFYMPDIWLRIRIARRKERIFEDLINNRKRN